MKLTALTRRAVRLAARARGGLAASCLGLLMLPGLAQSAWAQGQPPPQMPLKKGMNKNPFWLPINVDDRTRSALQELQLFVKDDPSRPWVLKDRQGPATTHFRFSPPADGEYWFRVVTVDKYNRRSPADLSQESPDVIVLFDTQPPLVDLRQLPPTPEGQRVQCLVRDLHPDPSKTRFEYQTADQVWRAGDVVAGSPDTFLVPVQANFTGKIKVTAHDAADNVTVREMDLQATSTSLKPIVMGQDRGAAVPTPGQLPLNPGPPASGSGFPPVNSQPQASAPQARGVENQGPELPPCGPGTTAGSRFDPQVTQAGAQQAPAAQGAGPQGPAPVQSSLPTPEPRAVQPTSPATSRNTGLPPTRKIVNNTHVLLEYKIAEAGTGGVGKVVVYLTADQGQSWKQLCEDQDRHNKVELDLPGEGVFGIRLVASNAQGFGAEQPSPGDTPDWWIEVDRTKPFVELGSVSPGVGEDAAALWITWNARDRNLSANPVDLYYAANRGGPWTAITKGVRNDGRYRWLAPPRMRLAYLKVVVTDKAGNSAHAETPTAVALDDGTRPVLHVTNITAPGKAERPRPAN
jgi:hypothetical protein